MKYLSTLLVLMMGLGFVACSEDDDPPVTPDPVQDEKMAMMVNAKAWAADTIEFGDPILQGGSVIKRIIAWQGEAGKGESIGFDLISLEPGTYPANSADSTVNIRYVADSDPSPSKFVDDPVQDAIGQIVILTNTAERMTGTFSFTGTSIGGTLFTITAGEFVADK